MIYAMICWVVGKYLGFYQLVLISYRNDLGFLMFGVYIGSRWFLDILFALNVIPCLP